LFLLFALARGGTAFAETLCGYLGYGHLLLRLCSRNGAHRPMHRGARYIGDFRDRCTQVKVERVGSATVGNIEKTAWEPRAPLTCIPEALTAGDRFRAGVGFVVQITAKCIVEWWVSGDNVPRT
jgi:hypothetical protein